MEFPLEVFNAIFKNSMLMKITNYSQLYNYETFNKLKQITFQLFLTSSQKYYQETKIPEFYLDKQKVYQRVNNESSKKRNQHGSKREDKLKLCYVFLLFLFSQLTLFHFIPMLLP